MWVVSSSASRSQTGSNVSEPWLCAAVCVHAQVVEHGHVGVGVVQVVGVGRVVLLRPLGRQGAVHVEDVVLWLGLVIHAVKAHQLNTHTQHSHSMGTALEPHFSFRLNQKGERKTNNLCRSF